MKRIITMIIIAAFAISGVAFAATTTTTKKSTTAKTTAKSTTPKATVKSSVKSTAKPTAKPTVTPAAKSTAKSTVKPTVTPAAKSVTQTPAPASTSTSTSTGEKVFTLTELAKFNGQNGAKAYVAVDGVVYDVTEVWGGGSHNGATAGKDLSQAIKQSPHGKRTLDRAIVVGKLK